MSSSSEERKLLLLETLVNDQKHLIQIMTVLNKNIEHLMIDMRDIKQQKQLETRLSVPDSPLSTSTSPSTPTSLINQQQNIENSLAQIKQENNIVDSTLNTNQIETSSIKNLSMNLKSSSLREFSTFVSRMVRQEFGCNYLAITRINDLNRYTMQRIKDEAIANYLPAGVSPQFAWNHAMNSLRQLRHRQCKKFKAAGRNLTLE